MLLYRVNGLLTEIPNLPEGDLVSSGYRPPIINAAVGGAKKSSHLSCEAIDLKDAGDKIDSFLDANPQLLSKYDLYREDPAKTKGWVHLQTRPTTARTFKV